LSLSPLSQYCIRKARELGEALYLVKFTSRETGEIVYEFFHHSLPGARIVLIGGNAGMSHPSKFEGDKRGFEFPGYFYERWKVSEIKEISLHENPTAIAVEPN
jgi:hypothetical protein